MAKAHVPTDKSRTIVSSWARVGHSQELICQKLGISKPTLEKHYRAELDLAAADMVSAVGSALYANAMQGNVTAQIFIMKTRAGWRETDRIEHTGADGEPFSSAPPQINVNFTRRKREPGGD